MTNKKMLYPFSRVQSETLKLAEEVRVAAAERQLSLHESQTYGWRKVASKNAGICQREKELASEVVKLKRQLAE